MGCGSIRFAVGSAAKVGPGKCSFARRAKGLYVLSQVLGGSRTGIRWHPSTASTPDRLTVAGSRTTLAMTSPASRIRVVPHDRRSDVFAFRRLDDRCVLVGALHSDNLRVLYALGYAVLCGAPIPRRGDRTSGQPIACLRGIVAVAVVVSPNKLMAGPKLLKVAWRETPGVPPMSAHEARAVGTPRCD